MDTYDFESKHIYRQRREIAIDRMASGNPFTRRVAYLDTKEALDTISYLKRGYQPQNLWAINRNPAEVACLTMKLQKLNLPTVNTVGLEFYDALHTRIPEVDIIDFDGMACLNDGLLAMLLNIIYERPNCVYSFTILGGRETQEEYRINISDGHIITKTSFNTLVNPNHAQRLAILLWNLSYPIKRDSSPLEENSTLKDQYQCHHHIEQISWDCYKSISKQPMIWAVTRIKPHKNLSTKYLQQTICPNELLPIFNCLIMELLETEGISHWLNPRMYGQLVGRILWIERNLNNWKSDDPRYVQSNRRIFDRPRLKR